jgi:cytochrome c oxidase cbb3-type subunit 3
MMPASAAMIDEQGLKDIVSYVLSLSSRNSSEGDAEAGKAKFMFCAACHGPDAKGNPLLGAPDLTDGIWLYGGTEKAIANTINNGRSGVMPAHKDILTAEQIHLVTAYIYSLSNN